MYDYDYGVYAEVGTFVSSRVKRGGFFRKINGWKGTKAEELTIICRGIILEMDFQTPNFPNFPKTPVLVAEKLPVYVPGLNKEVACIDIIGPISKQQVLQLTGSGLKAALPALTKFLNRGVDSNTRAVRFFTPSKVYLSVLDDQLSVYNEEELRRVFNASVKFFISSSILRNPISGKAFLDFWKGSTNLPIKRLAGGQVILGGKINNRWGGLVISKKTN